MRSIRHFRTGIGLAIVLTAGLAGQAWAASQIAYRLELGGNNSAEQWKAGTRVAYARGSSDDGQTFYKRNLLNYAVVLEASGIHSQPGHPSDNKEIYGAANAVFNLEFLDANDQPIGDVIFKSTINDGWDGQDPQIASFALGYTHLGSPGRLIDSTTYGGPRLQPIFTYPFAPTGSGTWIGMGAGYKEWVRTGSTSLWTMPGVGMVTVPPATVGGQRRNGMGIVPVAEGQIDVSNLVDGTYKLRVSAGNGNNVLRGDMDMLASTDRPAFAVAANGTTGHTITFVVDDNPPPIPCVGVVGRYVFYNNSAWDGLTPGITAADFNAIAPNKTPLLPGNSSSSANYISYSKSLNGIMIDVCHLNNVPQVDLDIMFTMGNTTDPWTWGEVAPPPNYMQLFPGQGVNGSDRLVITWPDNAIPNSTWLMVMLFANESLGIPADDFFVFGIAKGEGSGDYFVNSTDEIGCRNNRRLSPISNPAPIDFPWDYNRDKMVNSTDDIVARNNTTFYYTRLQPIAFPGM